MSKQVLSIKMVKKNGTLSIASSLMTEQYKIFTAGMKEGDMVDCLFETVGKDYTAAQLRKIHVMIKEIAQEQGDSFDNVKNDIKLRCGMTYKEKGNIKYQSFSTCSKEDLSQVIETIIQIGEFLNINFRHLE